MPKAKRLTQNDQDLLTLMGLGQRPHEPLRALFAVQLAGRLGRPAPSWAARIFDKLVIDRIEGQVKSLDVAFGFTRPSRGKTAPAHQRALDQRNELLCLDVYGLLKLGRSMEKACSMAAGRWLKDKRVNQTIYDLDPVRKASDPSDKRNKLADYLQTKIYPRWHNQPGAWLRARNRTASLPKKSFLLRFQ